MRVWHLAIKKQWKELYPTRWSLLPALLAELANLAMYWWISQTVTFKSLIATDSSIDYFTYVIVGEMALMVPSFLFIQPTQIFNQWRMIRLDTYLKVQPYKKLYFFLLMLLPIIVIKTAQLVIEFSLIVYFFHLNISFLNLILFFILILLSFPLFLSFGLFSAFLGKILGRGEKLISYLSNIGFLLSGVYFSTSVFSPTLEKVLKIISPYSHLLALVRDLIKNSISREWLLKTGFMFLEGTIILILLFVVFEFLFYVESKRSRYVV